MKKKKVALGLSGGVDSAVCARLLLDQGYDVSAIFLECWHSPGCRADQDRQDALKIATQLDIPFQVLDFKSIYHQQVIKRFIKEYRQGLTPNPDVWCNQVIKFGLFYEWAMATGFDRVATGHYARIGRVDEQLSLLTPRDLHKDQTYFIHQVQAKQLPHILFPLQNLMKAEVRQIARANQFHLAQKKDSVGICFVGDVNVQQLLKAELGENPGDVVDVSGQVIGRHRGLWFYTIGQRHGFEIQATTLVKQSDGTTISKHNIPPFYVVSKNAGQNQLVVGFGSETTTHSFQVSELHLINPSTQLATLSNIKVRVRHTGQLLACQITEHNQFIHVQLEQPQRGIAPGQYAVFYQAVKPQLFQVMGGGIIC